MTKVAPDMRRPAPESLPPGPRVAVEMSVPSRQTRDEAWADLLLSHPARRWARNVETRLALLRADDALLPLTINEAEYDNSYVCSPYTACVSYALTEANKVKASPVRLALKGLLHMVGPLLQAARINRVVAVNNWLLSTNLYPTLRTDLVPEITRVLIDQFPDRAVVWRSLTRATNGPLCDQLEAAGYLLAPSRQVYLFNGAKGDYLQRANTRWDRRLLDKTKYRVVSHELLQSNDAARMEHLYRLLYVEKHSPHNPQFTAEWFEQCRQLRLLELWGLQSPCGRLDGIVGAFDRLGVMTVPVVGYETSLPQTLGLYRMLMSIVMSAAARHGLLLNLSSGASQFKRLRGAQPEIEYSAIYVRHLPRHRRGVWQTLVLLLERIGGRVLTKYQL